MKSSPLFVELPQWARVALIVIAVAHFTFVFGFSEVGDAALLIVLAVRVFVTLLPILFYDRRWGACHPLVFVSVYSFVTLVTKQTPVFLYSIDQHVALPSYSPSKLNSLVVYTQVLTVLSVGALYFGFATIGAGHGRGVQQITSANQVTRLSTSVPGWVVGGMYLIAAIALAYLVRVSGGFTAHIKNLSRSVASRQYVEDVGSLGHIAVLVNLAEIGAVLAILSRYRRTVVIILCFVACGMGYLVNGRRSEIIYPMMLFALASTVSTRQIPKFKFFAVLVIAFVVVSVGMRFRLANRAESGRIDFGNIASMDLGDALEDSFSEFRSRTGRGASIIPIVAKVPDREPLLLGAGYLRTLGIFVPRFVWPTKPRGVDVWAGKVFYGRNYGIPPGPVGEAYWNFHFIGVLVVFMAYGGLLSLLYNKTLSSRLNIVTLAFYVITLFYFSPDQNSFRNWVYAIVPLVFYSIVFRVRLFERGFASSSSVAAQSGLVGRVS